MSKEKGTPAQKGTGSKDPMIQKLHTTGEYNLKIKLNRAGARALVGKDKGFLREVRAAVARRLDKLTARGV